MSLKPGEYVVPRKMIKSDYVIFQKNWIIMLNALAASGSKGQNIAFPFYRQFIRTV